MKGSLFIAQATAAAGLDGKNGARWRASGDECSAGLVRAAITVNRDRTPNAVRWSGSSPDSSRAGRRMGLVSPSEREAVVVMACGLREPAVSRMAT